MSVCVSVSLWINSLSRSFILPFPATRGAADTCWSATRGPFVIVLSSSMPLTFGQTGSFGLVGVLFGASQVQIV